MSIKLRLIIMNFLQFFLWGSWLTSIGVYLGKTLHFEGSEIGAVFSTLGIAAVMMPGIIGIIADKWIPAQKLYGFSHILGAVTLVWASTIRSPEMMFIAMLINSLCYMPTISLCYSVSYNILERNEMNIVTQFPPIRVFGTIGFILAMWTVDIFHWTDTPHQLLLGAVASFVLGIYSFTLPNCPIHRDSNKSLSSAMGLDALILFKQYKMAVFFIFAIFLGAALQITNAFGQVYLEHFKQYEQYKSSFAVLHPGILMSVSQISETLFILTIPFFLTRYGIKNVMLMSMIAWVLRFGLFSIGDPGTGFPMLLLSMVVYGMAFDFFTISGSLFVEKETTANIRSSAQGLYLMMTNGVGIIFGGWMSGLIVDFYTKDDVRNWVSIWQFFALYSLFIAILFYIFFRYKHSDQK